MYDASKTPFEFEGVVYYPIRAVGCDGCEQGPIHSRRCHSFAKTVEDTAPVQQDKHVRICGHSLDGVVWKSSDEAVATWTAERLTR